MSQLGNIWRRLVGSQGSEATAAATAADALLSLPTQIEVVPGKLTVRVAVEDRMTLLEGVIRCWSYISDGLAASGQTELAFLIRQLPGEAEGAFPRDLLGFYSLVHQLAEGGRLVNVGGFTILRPEHPGMMGRFHGVMYVPPVKDEDGPPRLMGVLLTLNEAKAAEEFGVARLMGTLGYRNRYFPTAVWTDRNRAELPLTARGENGSVLARVPHGHVPGLRAKQVCDDMDAGPAPAARLDGDRALVQFRGARLVLSFPEGSMTLLTRNLESLADNTPFALIADPDPRASAAFAWDPTEVHRQIIGYPGHEGEEVSGSFVLFAPLEQGESRATAMEDGFVVEACPDDWMRLRTALSEGRGLTLNVGGDIGLVHVQWRRTAIHGSPGQGFHASALCFYQNESVVNERLKSTGVLRAYLEQIESDAGELLADQSTADAFDVVVVVRPGRASRAWFVSHAGSMSEDRLAMLRTRIEEIPPPEVVLGPLAFAICGTIAGGQREVSGSEIVRPPMPREWVEAVENAGRPLQIPDEILPFLWPLEP